MNVIAEISVPLLHKSGDVVACPVCGQDEDLTLVIDSQDFGETPSYMRCDDMHQWSEPRVPSRIGAELLARKARDQPEMIRWPDAAEKSPPAPASPGERHGAGGRFRRRRPRR